MHVMNPRRIAAAFVFALAALAAGCTVREERVVVRERPPPRVEVIPARPSPAHVWVAGRWERDGDGWVWVRGTWVVR